MPVRIAAVCLSFALLAAAGPAAAQDEASLRSYFEGRRVTLRIDMPGSSDGVDVHADSSQPMDYSRYRARLRQFGASIRAGESAMVTLVKVKKDLVEFQLGGGGFGTFGDDTSTSVSMPLVEKSRREKELEQAVRDEDDKRRRRELQRDLDELRDRRERENRRIEVAKALAEERKREIVASKRRSGGARFNLRYDDAVPRGIRPDEIMAALAEYVDFSPASGLYGMRGTEHLPRKGMSRGDAELEFGDPIDVYDRREGRLTVTTIRFVSGRDQISAEFVEDVLIRFTIAPR
jgi:hypothetical protein